ncbi:hypothetical protein COCON_G00235950 [Conger conger]|uniref:Ig-like domain-containing protein n=1 Tax=Conger conger TaxID=82655 RepID=A0A9Q1CUE7_CONCO|nr:hypothetical protein COCON_G00235950 [Conger conger]
MGMVQWWTLLWISWYCHTLSAEVLVQYKYFVPGQRKDISLQAPAEPKGTEFIWEWTSHDGSNKRLIITIQSNGDFVRNSLFFSISKESKYGIRLESQSEIAGVFTFIQTKPENVNLAQIKVSAVKVNQSPRSIINEGSDVALSCEVSYLPDSATLAWERDREPTANTTLLYNNTAHIIIHSAEQYSAGTYNCTLRRNGALIFSVPHTFRVNEGTFRTHPTLYRGSLNSSEVVLICHSHSSFNKAEWYWTPLPQSSILLISADKHKDVSVSMETDKERFSFDVYDGHKFPLRISPVKFGDSGRYTCYYDGHVAATVTLVTIWVSAEPPGGLSRNQSVVLNCEISQGIDNVTLAWLRMKGGRGELVKQEVLTERAPKTMLSLTLPSLTEDQLHWACVVFTGSVLRAQVPLHLTLPTTHIKQGWSTETVVRVVIVALATLGMLLVLRWYWSWTRLQASEPESAQPEE